jgi:protein SCO1
VERFPKVNKLSGRTKRDSFLSSSIKHIVFTHLSWSILVFRLVSGIAFLLMISVGYVDALENPGADLTPNLLTTELGAQVNLGLRFTSASGQEGAISDFLHGGMPVILTPVYYSCPRLCGMVLAEFSKLLNKLDLNLGSDYEVATISFDKREGADKALKRANEFRSRYRNPAQAETAWDFFVGSEESIDPLMKQIGFHYMDDKGEFAHSAAIMILTPTGKISQYFTDINFSPFDVRLSLVEASQGKIGTPLDHFLLFCFRFDPTKGKYTWAAWNFVRVGVLLCAMASVFLIYRSSRKKTS